ncbi:MAG: sodium-dependent transporter [Deferribacterota bacterium]|nr:sodium-dependent transporter [Deferribacterota bacterium]
MKTDEWKSRYGFLLAAIGSSVGLGNIWRFPYIAYENGGGVFLIIYFFALLTAGIPILILEFSLGHKFKGSAPLTFARINKKLEWLGWWQVLISLIISIYYSAVIAWAIAYFVFSFDLQWGVNTIDFFLHDFLGITESPLTLGSLRINVLFSIFIVWLITYFILNSGIKKGIEVANKFLMPLLFVTMIIIMFRSIFLPGSYIGLNFLFTPDFSKILDVSAWVDAYGQVFFSLSVAFAIMITYSSYLPKKSDIINNAFITGFMDACFALISAIAIFSIVGFMTYNAGGEVPKNLQGVFLAFATIPKAINQMPFMPSLIGALFFLTVISAGITSEISITEAVVSSIINKLHRPRKEIVLIYCIFGFIVSILFATGGGLFILDIVDHFVNNYGIVCTGLVEVAALSWFFDLNILKDHANNISDFKINNIWNILIKFVTPIILLCILTLNIYKDIRIPYGGYSVKALTYLGWSTALLIFILSFLISKIKWYDKEILKGLK